MEKACTKDDLPNDLFQGLTMVVTGQFQNISRSDIEQLIKDKGGKNTSAVSGKTDFLIAGYKLEDGRDVNTSSKYQKAEKSAKTKILTEDEFEQWIRDKAKLPTFQLGSRQHILE